MKKLIIFLSILFVFSFTACQSGEKKVATKKNVTESNTVPGTGLHRLPEVDYVTPDPDNSAGLSTKMIEYGFGAAKNGKPHEISVNNQKIFDKYGAFCLDLKTKQKVLYMTFDCGYENGYTSPILDVLKEKKVPATFFVTLDYLKSEQGSEMANRMVREGHILGNHSASHPSFPKISRSQMTDELETLENYMRQNYGYTSRYFRFPSGEYSECALSLVSDTGYNAVFWSIAYLDYDVNNQPSQEEALDTLKSRLHPGAIILLHSVSKTNSEILAEFIDTARTEGYEFRSLEQFPVLF